MAESSDKQRLFVWDAPTRLFHWIVVASVIVAWATGEAESDFWFDVHLAAGYTVLAALIFRVVWGFAGSRHALFSDFVRKWPAVPARIREVNSSSLPRSIVSPRFFSSFKRSGSMLVSALTSADFP